MRLNETNVKWLLKLQEQSVSVMHDLIPFNIMWFLYLWPLRFNKTTFSLYTPLSGQVHGGCDNMEQGRAMGVFKNETLQCRPRSSGNNQPVRLQLNSAASIRWCVLSQPCVFVSISTAFKFKRFTETRLFAQFDKDIKSVKKMSLKFSTGNVLKPKYKLRVLRVRLTPLEHKERWAVAPVSSSGFKSMETLIRVFVGLSVGTTLLQRRTKRSYSGPCPVKTPTSESKPSWAAGQVFPSMLRTSCI